VFGALTADPSGNTILYYLQMPDAALAATLGLPATQGALIKGYILHVSMTYGKAAGAAVMGPFLGRASLAFPHASLVAHSVPVYPYTLAASSSLLPGMSKLCGRERERLPCVQGDTRCLSHWPPC